MKQWLIEGHERGFRLTHGTSVLIVPPTVAGLQVLYQMLTAFDCKKIGSPGHLTQAQLDHLVKTWKATNPPDVDLAALGLLDE